MSPFKKAGKSGPSGGQLKNSKSPNRKLRYGGRGKPVSGGRRGKSPFDQKGPYQGTQSGTYPIGEITNIPCSYPVDCYEALGQATCVPDPNDLTGYTSIGYCAHWIGDQTILGSNPDGSLIFSQTHTTMQPGWGWDAFGNKILVDSGAATECFAAGTKVTMGDGTEKNIEDIEIGEEVLSYNVKTKEFETKQTTDTITQIHDLKDGDITIKITLEDETVLHATIANPFWTPDEIFAAVDEKRCNRVHEWVKETNDGRDVVGLEVGDALYRNEDSVLKEVSIQNIEYVMERGIQTYDITVVDNHTFFANRILSHNTRGVDPPPGSGCLGGETWGDWNCIPNWMMGDCYTQNGGCHPQCGNSGYGSGCVASCSHCSMCGGQSRCWCHCMSE